MKALISLLVLAVFVSVGNGFSKYGRTCKDIGCLSNEQCTMAEDPCSYYNRDECGMYPTCQKVSSAAASCATYVCPPTKTCRMDGSTPKCIDDDRASSSNSFSNNKPISSEGNNNGHHAPPQIYPQIPGQTSTRAPMYRPNNGYSSNGGGEYQGGSIGSGYPGSGGYPTQNGGYPGYSGYPAGGSGNYPGYPSNGGYPNQGSGSRYPSGYPSPSGGSYPNSGGGYPNSGGYGGYNYNTRVNQNNPYGSGSTTSNPLLDGLKNKLKAYGLFYLIFKYLAGEFFL